MEGDLGEEFEKLMGFRYPGKKGSEVSLEKVINDTKVNVNGSIQQKDNTTVVSSDSDDEDDEVTIEKTYDNIPISNVVTLNQGSRIISAITCNSNGTRLVTGGYDYQLSFWDFHTMDRNLKSFRQSTPVGQHLIRNVAFSPGDDLILVCASNAQAKLLDKDGVTVHECIKGDQYIVDMQHTKGHVSMTYNACWNPVNLSEFMTCSQDGTIRIWKNVECLRNCQRIIKFRGKSSKPQPVTYCIYSHNGSIAYAASNGGVIQSFDLRKSSGFPANCITDAFSAGFDCSCLNMDSSGNYLSSRSTDDCMKLFDIRKFKSPIYTWDDLLNTNDVTKCIFSPDSKMLITGTSITKTKNTGYLMLFNTVTGEICLELPYESTGVVSQLWHPKLNQLFVGCSNGNIDVYFDPMSSNGGILKSVTHVKQRKQYAGEVLVQPRVLLPFARSTKMADNPSYFKLKAKAQTDPVLSKKPELPVVGPGEGGRLTSTLTVSAYMCKQLGISKKDDGDDNPREAILKYAKLAEEDPYFVAPAYKKTQPKPVFQVENESGDDDDDDDKDNVSSSLKSASKFLGSTIGISLDEPETNKKQKRTKK